MKPEEAIQNLEYAVKAYHESGDSWNESDDEMDEALKMAIEALEKQVAKKPQLEADGYDDGELVYDTWICPKCGEDYEIEYHDYKYCPNCGQKINWEETP